MITLSSKKTLTAASLSGYPNDVSKVLKGDGTWGTISAGTPTSTRQSFTATANQTTFSIAYAVGFVDVFVNGVKLTPSIDFTATNGTSVTLTVASTVGDLVDIIAGNIFDVASVNANNITTGTVATARLGSGTANSTTYLRGDGEWATINAGLSPWAAKTSAYTAVTKDRILADTTSAAFTITLPATPTVGDEVTIIDAAGTFATNNLTVGRNGVNILGTAQDLVLDIANDGVNLVYASASRGWVISR